MSDENQACCAHCKVIYKRIENSDGTCSDSWVCADNCGTKFVNEHWMLMQKKAITILTQERDDLKWQLAEKNETANVFMNQVKKLQTQLADTTQCLHNREGSLEKEGERWVKAKTERDSMEKERDEAIARCGVMREALEDAQTCLTALSPFYRHRDLWQEVGAEKTIQHLEKTLSTTPLPQMVSKEAVDKLITELKELVCEVILTYEDCDEVYEEHASVIFEKDMLNTLKAYEQSTKQQ